MGIINTKVYGTINWRKHMEENRANQDVQDTNTDNGSNDVEAKFTQEQVDEIINKRLARERAKFNEQLESRVNEAERLAKLSEEERKHEELRIQKEEFDAQIKEFEEMKRQFERTQLLNETQKQLSERDLPIDVAEMLIGVDAEATKANIDKFEAKWAESLQKAVNDKLNNTSVSPRTPVRENAGKHKNPKEMSFSEFAEYHKKHRK